MKLEDKYIDLIKEFVNIGMGASSKILNQMIDSHITLGVPEIEILQYNELESKLKNFSNETLTSVSMPFEKDLNGIAKLIFPSTSATKLVDMFIGSIENDSDMDALRISALTEIGNIIINTIIGSISNQINIDILYTIPDYSEGKMTEVLELEQLNQNHVILYCLTEFKALKTNISGNLMLFFEIGKFNEFVQLLDDYYNKIK